MFWLRTCIRSDICIDSLVILSNLFIKNTENPSYSVLSSLSYKYFYMFAGIACLLNKMNKPNVTIGVDGSMYRFHPHFHDLMTEKVGELVNPGITVQF